MPPRRRARSNPQEEEASVGGNNNQGNNQNDNQNNDGLNQLVDLLRRTLDRNQPNLPPNPMASAFKAFKSIQPPEFKGFGEPVEARSWLKEMEKSFKIIGVEEGQKTVFATYLLKGEANHWWESKEAMEPAGVVTWERFTELFLEKYFPEHMENRMEIRFLELKQNNKTVAEYEKEFTELSRFVPHFVDTDKKKARRFQHGLKSWIQTKVAAFELDVYAKVVNKAEIIEAGSNFNPREDEGKKRKAESWGGNQTKGSYQNQNNKRSGFQHGRSVGFNRTEGAGSVQEGQQRSVSQFSQSQPQLSECEVCGKKHAGVCMRTSMRCFNCGQEGHQVKNCPKKVVVCYKCGREGHISRDCRSAASAPAASRQSGGTNDNRSTARVFNMTIADGMKEMAEIEENQRRAGSWGSAPQSTGKFTNSYFIVQSRDILK